MGSSSACYNLLTTGTTKTEPQTTLHGQEEGTTTTTKQEQLTIYNRNKYNYTRAGIEPQLANRNKYSTGTGATIYNKNKLQQTVLDIQKEKGPQPGQRYKASKGGQRRPTVLNDARQWQQAEVKPLSSSSKHKHE